MADKNYQYRAQLLIVQGGYPGETSGVEPADTSWHTTSATSGTSTHTYYYNDSTCAQNSNSSRTKVSITDTWTVDIDSRNNMTVTVHTVINSIVRAAYQGNPNACGNNIVSDIIIRRESGGTILARYNNQSFATYTTVASNVDLGTETFTLAPGQNASRSTVHYTNDAHYTGGGQQGLYDDVMRMGINFRNILPADYRPGATLDSGSVWQSHNRDAGTAHILAEGGSWSTPQSASGNPINLSISESAAKMTSFTLDGDTSQVTLTGKNLFTFTGAVPLGQMDVSSDDNSVTMTGTGAGGSAQYMAEIYHLDPTKTYTLSGIARKDARDSGAVHALRVVQQYSDDGTTYSGWNDILYNSDATVGTDYPFSGSFSGHEYYRFYIYNVLSSPTSTGEKSTYYNVQLEQSATKTDFEPYCGEAPSPSPDYPQVISTVTGTQSIDINGTTYPIDLYDLELCKIGSYQDKIIKTGGAWYIRRQIGKVVLDENTAFATYPYGTNSYSTAVSNMANTPTSAQLVMSDRLYGVAYDGRTQAIQNMVYSDGGQAGQLDIRNTTWASSSDLTTWLLTHNTTVYYALATQTDEAITDGGLINQLEAIRTASLRTGSNVIANTSSNLAGDMEIEYIVQTSPGGGLTWTEMRTVGSPTEKGNPPSIRKSDAWYNQNLLGKE